MKNRFVWIVVMVSLVLVGCGDRAAPKLKECVDAETRKDIKAAIHACEEAALIDPRSASGREARARGDALKAEAKAKGDALQKERDAREKGVTGHKTKDGKPCDCVASDPLCDCL